MILLNLKSFFEMNEKTVLIVDDEPSNLEILVNSLQNLEYTVLMTNNASKAFEIAHLKLPDVIITDWEMPNIDGIELVKMIKRNEATHDIPVIMCTGVMMSSGNLKTALDAGAVDFIRKPIDTVELTARLNSAIRLSESLKKIKKLNDNKDKLFEIIAHDLTGPVGNINSILDPTLINLLGLEQLKEFLSSARISISATYSLLQNLLFWARSQRNKIEFSPNEYNLNEIISENIELLLDTANKKNINLAFDTNSKNSAFFDKNMILTVVRNLLANAIKFTPEGGQIKIVIDNEIDKSIIRIIDNGIGIKKENLNKIFADFGFTSFGTNNEKGSGIGLQVCKDFVNLNSGEIWVESIENVGSEFCFSLPNKVKFE